MSTEKIWQTRSISSADTEALGEYIGSRLQGGEVIELVSDLGGGKTTFTRGLARGAHSADAVASPTFTISREYRTPNFTIVHFDFYRLSEAGIVAEELREYAGDTQTVVVVEWGDAVQDVMPAARLRVEITHAGESVRDIRCTYAPQLDYLIPGSHYTT